MWLDKQATSLHVIDPAISKPIQRRALNSSSKKPKYNGMNSSKNTQKNNNEELNKMRIGITYLFKY